jgi:hypothetical protein
MRRTAAHSEGDLTWLIVLLAFALLACLGWVLFGNKRPQDVVGRPTPEDARVKLDAIDEQTQQEMKEERDAPLDQKVARLRALRERGRLRRDDK